MSLINHYTLQQQSGTTIPDAVGGINGTASKDISSLVTAGPAAHVPSAIDFDAGGAGGLEVVLDSSILLTGAFGVTYWARVDTSVLTQILAAVGGVDLTNHLGWNATTDNQARIRIAGAATNVNMGIDRNDWIHYAWVRSAANVIQLYLNAAAPLAVATVAGTLTIGRIGGFNAANNKMNGPLADVRVYNHALTADEIAAIYAPATEPPPSSVVRSAVRSIVGSIVK